MALPPPPPSASQPGPLHRLLLRVQFVELGGVGSEQGGAGSEQYRCRALSKDLRVRDVVALVDTTAHSIVQGLVEAEMPAVTEDVLARYALVMVYPTREADGSLTHLLHTLTPKERPLALVETVLAETAATTTTTTTSGSAIAPGGSDDEGGNSEGFSRQQLLEENLLSWFLKDLGGAPLDFRGYVSGAETSEDEAAAPWYSDMNQLGVGQGYYSGYLLKQSSQDPCLWRRRWCILGEDKVWYMKLKHRRSHQGRAAFISLVSNQVLEHPRTSKVQFGIEMHTAHRVFLFRAADRTQQLDWIRALQIRIALSSENDLIAMAELMICDEERARARRLQQAVEHVWTAAGVSQKALAEEEATATAMALTRSPSPRFARPATPSGSSGSGGGSSAAPKQPPAYMRLFARRYQGDLAESLAFAVAVQEYKELCRQDDEALASSEKKWAAAQAVFDEFLRGRVVVLDDDDDPNHAEGQNKKKQQSSRSLLLGGPGAEESLPGQRFFRPRRAAVKEVERQLDEHAQRVRERQEPTLTGGGRIVTSTGLLSIPRFLGGRAAGASGAATTTATQQQQHMLPPPKDLFENLMQGLEKSTSLM